MWKPAGLACVLALMATAPSPGAAQDAEARYQALLGAAQAGDKAVDWRALRFAYADRPGFNVADEGSEEGVQAQKMRAAYRSGDCAGAIAAAKLVADQDFVDPEVHLIESQCFAKQGIEGGAERERAIAVGLLQSIQTGDGRSEAQAFTVISTKEEYILMASDGRRVIRQWLQQDGGHRYDVLETVDRAGAAPATFYFLIDRVLAAQTHVLRLPGAK